MSAKYYQKNPVSSNFEQHIIFKLMTYRSPNSIALSAIDNDLLTLKQWKLSFFKYIFQKASQLRNYPICKTEQLHEAVHGETVGVKFSILLLYEAVGATVSLIPA